MTFEAVSPGYFETLAIPILNGRAIDESDLANSPGVAMINATMARRYWPGENPIGKQIRMEGRPLTVEGVAADGKYGSLGEDQRPCFYIPLSQAGPESSTSRVKLIVRAATADPRQLITPVLAQIQGLDSNLPILRVMTMTEHLYEGLGPERANATLLGIFSFLALGLAGIGIYGVISYAVAQRTHEIGIRMAMGAQRKDVVRMVLRHSLALAAIGVSIGAALALVLARALTGFLYGVGAAAPLVFSATAASWFALAVVATWIPARRATRVDPLIALRC